MSEPILQSRRSLYVGGLADSISETALRAAMIPFGPIKSVEIPRDYQKGTHKGFGFVEYEDADDAAEAIHNMDGAELLGKALNVNLAQLDKHKLGSFKPIWSSDDWFKQQAAGEEKENDINSKLDSKTLQPKSLVQ